MMLEPGSYLQDRYEIISLIGTGGMSEVYQAKCHKLNRMVAIKVLKEEYLNDKNFTTKFKMEAQSAAALSHPNIVSVYDVIDDEDCHYIVMELIEGITLKTYISKKGKLGIKEAIGIAIQVAQGMAAAHDQHLVHRDIKPQNIIISRDAKVKVADFGIARAVSTQTEGSNAVGSVHYISPEQAKGEMADSRSDIYSLGVTLYEMLTGTLPFDGDNTVAIAISHLQDVAVPPSVHNAEIPASLDRIILKCIAKKPDDRYQNAYELISDLRRSLVDPGDSYLAREPEIHTEDGTRVRTVDEIRKIAEADKKRQEEKETVSAVKPETRNKTRRSQSERTNTSKRNRQDDTRAEKLLSIIGVLTAVILVGGILWFVSKKTRLFEPNIPETTVVVEETLSKNETRVPSLLGLNEKDAQKAIDNSELRVHIAYSASEDDRKGLVIGQSIESNTVVEKFTEIEIFIGTGKNIINIAELSLKGRTLEEAKDIVESQKLNVTVSEAVDNEIPKGVVIGYEPESAEPGETVVLTVSSGPEIVQVQVPPITGMSADNARVILETLHLALGRGSEERSKDVPKGFIIRQSVAAETVVPEGTAIDYVVSSGRGTRYVAAINEDFSMQDLFGPSSGDTSLDISIVMKQIVNGEVHKKVILEPRTVTGNITLPIHYNIEGVDGVLTGELDIVDLTNDRVLKKYDLTFIEVDR